MVKVVLIGDCHGKVEAFDSALKNEEPFNFFLSVGDVACSKDSVSSWYDRGFVVLGNHDSYIDPPFRLLTIDQYVDDLHICGLNGMLKSRTFLKETSSNVSFREILYASHLKDLQILVTHQPPSGVYNWAGEAVLNELVNYTVPRIYVSGHIHKYRVRFYLNTFILSLPPINKGYGVAYFEGKELKNLEMVFKKGKKVIRI